MALKKKSPRRTTSKGEKGWPVRLAFCESAILKQDEYIFREAPWWVDTVVNDTAARVEENGQTGTLESLCKQTCPRRELLYLLGMCENRGVTNALKATGYDSSALKQKLRDLRKCADAVWRLNGHAVDAGWGGTAFGMFLETAAVKLVKPSTLAKFLEMPTHLEEYASLVEHAATYLGGKSDFYLHLAKALLVRFVHEHTNKNHDKIVADLLSVMLGLEYGEVDHRIWRSKYHQRHTHYRPDPTDSPVLRAKKTLLECTAAVFYRMDVGHPGEQYLRQNRLTILRYS
jgi:hypothetical protein